MRAGTATGLSLRCSQGAPIVPNINLINVAAKRVDVHLAGPQETPRHWRGARDLYQAMDERLRPCQQNFAPGLAGRQGNSMGLCEERMCNDQPFIGLCGHVQRHRDRLQGPLPLPLPMMVSSPTGPPPHLSQQTL